MNDIIQRYRHYWLLIAALCLVHYIIMPLYQWQTSQQQQHTLLVKKQRKTLDLLADHSALTLEIGQINSQINSAISLVYNQQNETDFKIKAQQNIEQALKKAGCQIDRIGFKNSTIIQPGLWRWHLEVRYQGKSLCLIQSTRALETMQPLVKIEDYTINHRGFTIETTNSLSVSMNLSLWHLKDRE
jgi:hypothetical protein